MPLVSQRHLLGFLIAALDLAAAARLVAVGAACQGDELAGRPGLAPATVLLAAWVFGLGAWHFNDNTEWHCTCGLRTRAKPRFTGYPHLATGVIRIYDFLMTPLT